VTRNALIPAGPARKPFLTHVTLREIEYSRAFIHLRCRGCSESGFAPLGSVTFLVRENGYRQVDVARAIAWSVGFFLRAETFFNFATYLEDVGSSFIAYGGKSLHQQSHGEAFLSLFSTLRGRLYFWTSRKRAFTPRQLAFLRVYTI